MCMCAYVCVWGGGAVCSHSHSRGMLQTHAPVMVRVFTPLDTPGVTLVTVGVMEGSRAPAQAPLLLHAATTPFWVTTTVKGVAGATDRPRRAVRGLAPPAAPGDAVTGCRAVAGASRWVSRSAAVASGPVPAPMSIPMPSVGSWAVCRTESAHGAAHKYHRQGGPPVKLKSRHGRGHTEDKGAQSLVPPPPVPRPPLPALSAS